MESIRDALREWRRENPRRKPNPGDILQLLRKAWGEFNAPAVRAAMAEPQPVRRKGDPEAMDPQTRALLSQFINRVEPPREIVQPPADWFPDGDTALD